MGIRKERILATKVINEKLFIGNRLNLKIIKLHKMQAKIVKFIFIVITIWIPKVRYLTELGLSIIIK